MIGIRADALRETDMLADVGNPDVCFRVTAIETIIVMEDQLPSSIAIALAERGKRLRVRGVLPNGTPGSFLFPVAHVVYVHEPRAPIDPCPSCGVGESNDAHTCPYKEEIDNDSETECWCCDDCIHGCGQEV